MRRLRIFLTLLIICTGLSTVHAKETKVGVVVTVQGPVKVKRRKEDTAKARTALRILMTLNEGDKIVIPDKSEVTITVLSSGIRYTLLGPLDEVTVPADGVFQVDKSKIKENKQAGREGIVATNNVDFKKMGGGSGRSLGSQIYSHTGSPRLPLDVVSRTFEFNTPADLNINYRPIDAEGKSSSKWLKGAAIVSHRDDGKTVVIPKTNLFSAGQFYGVRLTDVKGDDESYDFRVYCLSADELKSLKKVESAATGDLSSQVELYNNYLTLKLYEKAEDKLREIQKTAPTAQNWPEFWREFEETRRASQSGSGDRNGPTTNGKEEDPGSGPVNF